MQRLMQWVTGSVSTLANRLTRRQDDATVYTDGSLKTPRLVMLGFLPHNHWEIHVQHSEDYRCTRWRTECYSSGFQETKIVNNLIIVCRETHVKNTLTIRNQQTKVMNIQSMCCRETNIMNILIIVYKEQRSLLF